MMLLTTRLHIDPDGKAHIPGGLEVWRDLFVRNPQGKYDAKLSKSAANWKDPDDVLEALFALCRKPVDNEPLKIFMALTDIDRNRAAAARARNRARLIKGWNTYGAQYTIFSDAPRCQRQDDRWLARCRRSSRIKSATRRSGRTPSARCRVSPAYGRSSAARAASRSAKADETLAGDFRAFRIDEEQPRTFRCRPRRG